jgi:hypothetical protein
VPKIGSTNASSGVGNAQVAHADIVDKVASLGVDGDDASSIRTASSDNIYLIITVT